MTLDKAAGNDLQGQGTHAWSWFKWKCLCCRRNQSRGSFHLL